MSRKRLYRRETFGDPQSTYFLTCFFYPVQRFSLRGVIYFPCIVFVWSRRLWYKSVSPLNVLLRYVHVNFFCILSHSRPGANVHTYLQKEFPVFIIYGLATSLAGDPHPLPLPRPTRPPLNLKQTLGRKKKKKILITFSCFTINNN